MITGKYLTVESDVVSASDSHQGGFSQWIWEPRTGNNPDSIWGFIRSLTAVKNNNPNAKMYLAIGNDFICVPEANKVGSCLYPKILTIKFTCQIYRYLLWLRKFYQSNLPVLYFSWLRILTLLFLTLKSNDKFNR